MITAAAWLALSLVLLSNWIGEPLSPSSIVGAVGVIIPGVLLWKPAWRPLWNKTGFLGRWLSEKVYPDLNGTYDVVLESNWPVVKQMLDAARKDAPAFDPFNLNQPAPQLLNVELEAVIEQSWFEIEMSMRPKKPGAAIEKSRTLATIPTKDPKTGEKGLVYVFCQKNALRAPTDDLSFLGAAKLQIDGRDHTILTGDYWNNRGWHRGINAAGKLRLVRRP